MTVHVTRRGFVAGCAALATGAITGGAHAAAETRPNILWIFGDDLGVELGCYDHPAVRTPNIDRLAAQGCLYRNCFTPAPVCSASRSALITGMYQTTIGCHHHRSHRDDGYRLPSPLRLITDIFREAGYFTANVTTPAPGLKCAGKTDFNFNAPSPFDGTDWSQRKPGQPFYAQINFHEPHRAFPRQVKDPVDPSKVRLPAWCADHPTIREDWASYLNAIQVLDDKVGRVLKRLDDEGLADNTVIMFVGDNGQCHFRGKQFLYDAGIHVPLIVRWPGKVDPGSQSEQLISGIDWSATSLAIAGIEVPGYMQGRVFLGENRSAPRQVIFAARDRCDETVDRIRCVRDKRFKYIRNFMPDRPYTQPNAYKERSYPALAVMKELYAAGRLNEAQAAFFRPARPVEELYDLSTDPDEVNNLAAAPEHGERLKAMRAMLDQWIVDTKDQGEIPEKT